MIMAMTAQAQPIGNAFINQAVAHLQEDLLPKIRKCLDILSEEDTWWRESEAENSVGNMLLHLSGNVRRWIISGLGDEPHRRNRPGEFAARGAMSRLLNFV
jgi:hypothetical protein